MFKTVEKNIRKNVPKITCNKSQIRLNHFSVQLIIDKLGKIPEYAKLLVDEQKNILAIQFADKPATNYRKIAIVRKKDDQKINALQININEKNYEWMTVTVGKKMLASFQTIGGSEYLIGKPINQRKEDEE